MEIVRKYAKDLIPGDKVNGHERGWLTVEEVERIYLTHTVNIKFYGAESETLNSHVIFDDVLTD